LSKVAKSISFLNFRLMDIIKFNASLNNQWPLYWFTIQADSRGPQKSTIKWYMCLLVQVVFLHSFS
jgi:hypothetical protein